MSEPLIYTELRFRVLHKAEVLMVTLWEQPLKFN